MLNYFIDFEYLYETSRNVNFSSSVQGDRILMFNQFTMMMDIVEVYLQARGYKYLRFDGSVSVDERYGSCVFFVSLCGFSESVAT